MKYTFEELKGQMIEVAYIRKGEENVDQISIDSEEDYKFFVNLFQRTTVYNWYIVAAC